MQAGAALYEKAAPAHDQQNPFLAAIIASGEEQTREVWPENWRAFELFNLLRTQWNVGYGGTVGLRYEAAYPLIDREAADADDWQHLFEDLRVLERGALDAINTKD